MRQLVADIALAARTATDGHQPTRSGKVSASDEGLGVVGEVDPGVLEAYGIDGRVGWLEVDLGRLLAVPRRPLVYAPISRFPSSDVDLAFVVPDAVPAAAVEATLRRAAGDLLVHLALFDVYRDAERLGDGVRSLAFALRFQAADRTLTDEEVAAVRQRCIDAVGAGHDAKLRG